MNLITPELIKRCILKLKSGKGDGNEGFTSDDLINSCRRLHSVLAMLCRSIIYHGHYPGNLLKSTIILIPKDAKASLSNVDNYRGISLSNSINKVFDYVIIELYQDKLISFDMQFAYKTQHSTALCRDCNITDRPVVRFPVVYWMLVKPLIVYIMGNCLICYLIEICQFLLFVLYCYSRQQSRAMWNSCYTDYFCMSNGVKQESVLSAILFTIYIDKMLIMPRDSGFRCKIDN